MEEEKQMKINTKKASRLIGFHGLILLKGIARMLFGALTASILALGIYGFFMIPTEGGYDAVFDFLASICIICIALAATYLMGGHGKKGAKK